MSNAPEKRKALGKGLSALLPARPQPPAPSVSGPTVPPHASGAPAQIPVSEIHPNPLQPRTNFEPVRLEELAQSIRVNGIIQPLVVRKAGDGYELVAGERRWRAAKIAGMQTVPAIIQDFSQERLLELALIENIQREDLNPIEAAHAFDRLAREMGLSHEEIGRRTGKDRSTIANSIRLLKLPPEVQQFVVDGQLAMGQARAILALLHPLQQIEIAKKAVGQGLSTRQVESLVRKITDPPPLGTDLQPPLPEPLDANARAAIAELERVLGTRVRIIPRGDNRGRIEIEYYSQDDLHRVYSQIVGEN
jgi:ParB family chromosome partitioning protein